MKGEFDRRRWIRIARNTALSLAALLVVVGVVGFFVAPRIVQSIAQEQIAEQLGRKATIGAVELNPYRLAATIRDFTLFEADGTTPAVRFDTLLVNVSSASLFKRALVFDAIRLIHPQVRVARLDADRYSFTDIVDRLATKPKTDDPPPRVSLNNIEVENGRIEFDDQVTKSKHVVDDLTIGLPFLSNLPYDTDVYVTPAFSANVNGSRIALDGKAQPFSTHREATLIFDVADLDLPTYAAFVPGPLGFKVASGKLGAKLTITFKAASQGADGQAVPQSLVIAGPVTVDDLGLTDPASHPLVGFKRLAIDAENIAPLDGVFAIRSIVLSAPQIHAIRKADGSVDLATAFVPTTPATATAPKPDGPKVEPVLTIASVRIEDGRLDLTDQTLPTAPVTRIEQMTLKVENVALQGDRPTTFDLGLREAGGAALGANGSILIAKKQVTGSLGFKDLKPGAFSHYYASFLAARIGDGTVSGEAAYTIDASGPQVAGRIEKIHTRIEKLRTDLPNEKTSLMAAESIVLANGAFDLGTRAFTADSLTFTAPVVAIVRDRAGRLNLQNAVAAPQTSKTSPTDGVVEIKPPDAKPFTAAVRALVVERGNVSFDDLSTPTPVRLRASPFDFRAENVGTDQAAIVPFKLDTTVDRRGKLGVQGRLTLAPLSLEASIDASRVAVGWLAGYAGDRLNVVVEDADLNLRGDVRLKGPTGKAVDPTVSYKGSFGIVRMRALDRITSQEFIRWKQLEIPKVEFDMPAKGAPFSVQLATVALDDFYARLIVNANGRLNVQDVVTPQGQQRSVTTPDDETPAQATPPTEVKSGKGDAEVDRPVPAKPSGPMPHIRIAGIKLTQGRVGFTDNLIRPNYSVNLTALTGDISTLAMPQSQPADVRVQGKIDGDGTLDVSGKIDPFAASLFVDIAAEAKDIELTRLTPYAVKYAGYPIERGRLSTTVKYHIENGKLEAQNRLFLDQLTFGERDASSPANLPVRLAVALLKNSRGEIDINLPVTGSLSDPQFSIGGVIFRALLNLIARAATSPFALIGSAFGGGGQGELGYIQFAPGVSDLTPQGKEKLVTLAKALTDRPALRLDIIGRYDPATDPEGIKQDHLLDRLKDLKAKELSKGGERVRRDEVTISPDEYPKYLAQVYDDTKLPDKPRNLIGMAKAIPTDEMERRLLAEMKLDPNDPRWLADARADVVRHYLEDQKIAASRLFLVTPKLTTDGITDKGAPNRVDFSLR